MPIAVICKCGGKFSAPDTAAGVTTACPKCGRPIVVASPAAPLFEVEGPVPASVAQVSPELAPRVIPVRDKPSGPWRLLVYLAFLLVVWVLAGFGRAANAEREGDSPLLKMNRDSAETSDRQTLAICFTVTLSSYAVARQVYLLRLEPK